MAMWFNKDAIMSLRPPVIVVANSMKVSHYRGKCQPSGFTRRLNRKHGSIVLPFVVDIATKNYNNKEKLLESRVHVDSKEIAGCGR
nr:hypothetical protein [Tanacetum cinerariifolium]